MILGDRSAAGEHQEAETAKMSLEIVIVCTCISTVAHNTLCIKCASLISAELQRTMHYVKMSKFVLTLTCARRTRVYGYSSSPARPRVQGRRNGRPPAPSPHSLLMLLLRSVFFLMVRDRLRCNFFPTNWLDFLFDNFLGCVVEK